MLKILWINNDGGGFADYVDVEPETTVEKFIAAQLPEAKAADYLIRVNRMPVSRTQALQDGDRVTCTPVKIEGAEVD